MTIKSISSLVPAPSVIVTTAPYAPTGGILIGSSNTQFAFGVPQTVTFQTNEFGLGFAPGVRIRAAVTLSPNNWMEGIVQSYVEPALTVQLTLMSASPPVGLQGPWTISVTGAPGTQGPKGDQGAQGPPGIGGAPIDSPVFTGQPQVPTPVLHDNSTVIPNTNWVGRELTYFAPLASPNFSGNPTAPTQGATDNSTKIATTAMVQSALATMTSGLPEAPATGGPYARKTSAWYDLTPDFAAKAPLASPALTGTPTAPLAADLDNSTKIATTSWVNRAISEAVISSGGGIADAPNDGGLYSRKNLTWVDTQPLLNAKADVSLLNNYAPLASPTFTGAPAAPTPAPGDSSTRLATTAFISGFAPLASPNFTGTPTAPTQPTTDNSTTLATTAFVRSLIDSLTLSGRPFSFSGGTVTWINATTLSFAQFGGSDGLNSAVIRLPSMTKTTAAWAAGSGNGALAPGVTLTAAAWYTIYAAIINGSPDVFYDNTCPPTHLPTGTTAWRRLMSFRILNPVSVGIRKFTMVDREVTWSDTPGTDYSGGAISGLTPVLPNIPPGVRVMVRGTYVATNSATAVTADISDAEGINGWSMWSNTGFWAGTNFYLRSNKNQQLQATISTQPNSNSNLTIKGWTDSMDPAAYA